VGTKLGHRFDGDDLDADPERPGRWSGLARKLPATGAVLVGTFLICAHAALYGHWLVDDAAITFDYARNVAEGYGPVLQPGATPVEGYSNTLWLVLLVLGRWLGLFDHGLLLGIPDYVVYRSCWPRCSAPARSWRSTRSRRFSSGVPGSSPWAPVCCWPASPPTSRGASPAS
jgi:hypothetical protein